MTTPSDETKVPPGWVRLTYGDNTGGRFEVRASSIRSRGDRMGDSERKAYPHAQSWIEQNTDAVVNVRETFAEVAALIAEAEAAERRARALPVMAAVCFLARATHPGADVDAGMAVGDAAAILDAIERREGE